MPGFATRLQLLQSDEAPKALWYRPVYSPFSGEGTYSSSRLATRLPNSRETVVPSTPARRRITSRPGSRSPRSIWA